MPIYIELLSKFQNWAQLGANVLYLSNNTFAITFFPEYLYAISCCIWRATHFILLLTITRLVAKF